MTISQLTLVCVEKTVVSRRIATNPQRLGTIAFLRRSNSSTHSSKCYIAVYLVAWFLRSRESGSISAYAHNSPVTSLYSNSCGQGASAARDNEAVLVVYAVCCVS